MTLAQVDERTSQAAQRAGLDAWALQRYVEEQIYTLPGTTRHREEFTVAITGSRAAGTHVADSDVDIDVLCPRPVYERVHAEASSSGLAKSDTSFLCLTCAIDEDWRRYFGETVDGPHFSLHALEDVQRQFDNYQDVALWNWTNAIVVSDPHNQFERIREGFGGYPRDVLVRKLKYHWLMCWQWAIVTYPHHHRSDDELIAAASGLLNGIQEMLRVFFLVENKPFPYAKRIAQLAGTTALGREFGPLLQRWTELIVGKAEPELSAWERLDKACGQMLDDTDFEETVRLEEVCTAAIIAAGVEPSWMKDYFASIEDLYYGSLGPAP